MLEVGGVTYYEMADAIDPQNLPSGMDAYLGYVDGRWPDYAAIAQREGGVPCYGLTVFGSPSTGDGTDSEPGNADISQTVLATKGELARGIDRPIVYCPASWASDMVTAHTQAGIPRQTYRLLTAHYGWANTIPGLEPSEHICGPTTCGYGPGSNGTQWKNDIAPGYDLSILDAGFINAIPHPGPSPEENTMGTLTHFNDSQGNNYALAYSSDNPPHLLRFSVDVGKEDVVDLTDAATAKAHANNPADTRVYTVG